MFSWKIIIINIFSVLLLMSKIPYNCGRTKWEIFSLLNGHLLIILAILSVSQQRCTRLHSTINTNYYFYYFILFHFIHLFKYMRLLFVVYWDLPFNIKQGNNVITGKWIRNFSVMPNIKSFHNTVFTKMFSTFK